MARETEPVGSNESYIIMKKKKTEIYPPKTLFAELNSKKQLTSNLPTLLKGLRSPNERVATGPLPILLNVD